MSGYCISLYKFMRIDEDLHKRDVLLNSRVKSTDIPEGSNTHTKFIVFGEFDRISFDAVRRFPRYRDMPGQAKRWVGDRQVHLVYELDGADEICYENNNFYVIKNGNKIRSEHLFVGLTQLQMKYSQKENCNDLLKYLGIVNK